MKRSLTTSALALAAALALVGCAGAGAATTATNAAGAGAGSVAETSVTLTDGWAKAAETGMTAVFGELENTGSEDLVVVAVETDAAQSAELHEMVDDGGGTMTMREKDGGFPLDAGDHLHLEPGGNHIMLLGIAAPLLAGDEVAVTITFDDGSTLEATVPVKDYDGANESYDDGEHEAH
ncbi:copper chaperone PCu(A)C [Agromyces sp. NPDC049794]|uniref:copper chaperone PCu(A)C n=1 Tax=unclassified Agromyces TaxID=2639701 RepID=UPI003411E192